MNVNNADAKSISKLRGQLSKSMIMDPSVPTKLTLDDSNKSMSIMEPSILLKPSSKFFQASPLASSQNMFTVYMNQNSSKKKLSKREIEYRANSMILNSEQSQNSKNEANASEQSTMNNFGMGSQSLDTMDARGNNTKLKDQNPRNVLSSNMVGLHSKNIDLIKDKKQPNFNVESGPNLDFQRNYKNNTVILSPPTEPSLNYQQSKE